MLTKLAFCEQQNFALFRIHNSDFVALSDKNFLAHSLFQTLRSDKIGRGHHRKAEPNLLEYLLLWL